MAPMHLDGWTGKAGQVGKYVYQIITHIVYPKNNALYSHFVVFH